MTTYFPDMNYAETSPDYDSFWQHEWDKHGTCVAVQAGLSQNEYFEKALELFLAYNQNNGEYMCFDLDFNHIMCETVEVIV
jgi:ribonuclease I